MPRFTCPRCGSVSHSRHDAYAGYCGRCHDWTARPCASGGPVPGVQVLTPYTLLDDWGWTYEGTQDEGRIAVYRFDVLRGPRVSCWRPDLSLGPFTADWTDSQLTLRVSTEVMARAVMERLYLHHQHAWSWDELRRLYELAHPPQLLYACPQCGTEFTVPPGHGEPVLCGSHSPPQPMSRVIRAEAASFDYSAVPGQVFAAGTMTADQLASGPVVARLAGHSVDVQGELDPEAWDALGNEIRPVLPPGRPPTWVADAVAVWEGCKDAARRERTLAELAQDVADATPQIAPDEREPDCDTRARWSPDDPGDVIL